MSIKLFKKVLHCENNQFGVFLLDKKVMCMPFFIREELNGVKMKRMTMNFISFSWDVYVVQPYLFVKVTKSEHEHFQIFCVYWLAVTMFIFYFLMYVHPNKDTFENLMEKNSFQTVSCSSFCTSFFKFWITCRIHSRFSWLK